MILRALVRLLAVVLILGIALAATVKVRYGGGADFPDRRPGPARLPETALEVVADLPTPPGNIAVSRAGRVFVTLHPEARPEAKVVELVGGRPVPFPSVEFQDADRDPRHFRDVLALRIDRGDKLWTLDNGRHGIHPARLLAFDLERREPVHEFEFPRALAGWGSDANDFQVSPDGRHVFIADASFFARSPALVVYDVGRRRARRLLEGHPAVTPDRFTPAVEGRRMEALGLVAIRPGVDSIALDQRGEWLYFAPPTSLHLYRVRAADLLDEALAAAELSGRVEVFAPKTMSAGLTIDAGDTIYLSDFEHSAVVALRPDRTLETVLQSQRLRWPDGFSFGPGGWLYLTCSSLHEVVGRLPSSIGAHAPYQVFRAQLGVDAAAGH